MISFCLQTKNFINLVLVAVGWIRLGKVKLGKVGPGKGNLGKTEGKRFKFHNLLTKYFVHFFDCINWPHFWSIGA